MAEQSQSIADAAKHLAETDAQSRQEMIEFQSRMQEDLNTERRSLDRQREDLDANRQQLARERQRERLLVEAITQAAFLAVVALPLIVCLFVFRAVYVDDGSESEIGSLVIDELIDQQSWHALPPRESQAALEQRENWSIGSNDSLHDDADSPDEEPGGEVA